MKPAVVRRIGQEAFQPTIDNHVTPMTEWLTLRHLSLDPGDTDAIASQC
jgi:hypothetical protein